MSQKKNIEIAETALLDFLKRNPSSSSSDIYTKLSDGRAYSTVKRLLLKLQQNNLIVATGRGRSTRYTLSPAYELFYDIDPEAYFENEIDDRDAKVDFNFNLISETLGAQSLFTKNELDALEKLNNTFHENVSHLSQSLFDKEMERLAIDLSWKSSQIEGNTYSLLETERLLKEHETAKGKTKDEAVMLLNHKEAINFIVKFPDYVVPLKISAIEDIHSILMKDLDVERNLRRQRVGISGTNYRPLDNEHQIREAIKNMCDLINLKDNVFEKALLALVLISYIQPFADGNKRTARILSNAILIANNFCPISFRTVDSIAYKKAMLIFYEQNNISVFKQIFIAQFKFAVTTYF